MPHLSLVHVWARPVRPAGRTHKRAAPYSRGGASTPGNTLAAKAAQRSRADNCAPCSLTEGLPDCPQAVSRPPRAHQPGHASLAWPRPVTRPPLHPAQQPQEGNSYTREGFNGKPQRPATQTARTSPPPGSPGPRSRVGATPNNPAPTPQTPTHTKTQATPTKPVTPQPTTTPNNTHTTPPTQTPAHTPGPGQCEVGAKFGAKLGV